MMSKWTARTWEHLKRIHEDEGGVAMTEYVIVLTVIVIGAAVSLLGVSYYVKAYRDFLVWWLTHPAV